MLSYAHPARRGCPAEVRVAHACHRGVAAEVGDDVVSCGAKPWFTTSVTISANVLLVAAPQIARLVLDQACSPAQCLGVLRAWTSTGADGVGRW